MQTLLLSLQDGENLMESHQRSSTGVSGGPRLLGSGGSEPFNGLVLAPLTWGPRPQGNMVTNSSEAVGWIATQLSKSALVAPIFRATANPCSISSAACPITCSPTTCSSFPAQTNFLRNERMGNESKHKNGERFLGMKGWGMNPSMIEWEKIYVVRWKVLEKWKTARTLTCSSLAYPQDLHPRCHTEGC